MGTGPEAAPRPEPPAKKAAPTVTDTAAPWSARPVGGGGLGNAAALQAAGPPPAGGHPAYPLVLTPGSLVQVPGRTGFSWLASGGPVEPRDLAALLLAALGGIARGKSLFTADPVLQFVTRKSGSTPLSVPEVLRLGDRVSWAAARKIFEADTGMRMLFVLRTALSEREVGAIMPYLHGVVPTAELLDIWDGFFSNDTAGIIRTINRMPDDEALAMVAEYAKACAGRKLGRLPAEHRHRGPGRERGELSCAARPGRPLRPAPRFVRR